jgi:co-chaperonin GroES (HSP10)
MTEVKKEIENTSGLKPLGRAVLVEHYEPERVGSLIVMPESVHVRTLMVEQRAVVIEVGPEAWKEERGWSGLIKRPRARPGDLVLISAMAGYMAQGTADGRQYRLVNDRDVFAKITKEKAL